jgi:hypothetical protein
VLTQHFVDNLAVACGEVESCLPFFAAAEDAEALLDWRGVLADLDGYVQCFESMPLPASLWPFGDIGVGNEDCPGREPKPGAVVPERIPGFNVPDLDDSLHEALPAVRTSPLKALEERLKALRKSKNYSDEYYELKRVLNNPRERYRICDIDRRAREAMERSRLAVWSRDLGGGLFTKTRRFRLVFYAYHIIRCMVLQAF